MKLIPALLRTVPSSILLGAVVQHFNPTPNHGPELFGQSRAWNGKGSGSSNGSVAEANGHPCNPIQSTCTTCTTRHWEDWTGPRHPWTWTSQHEQIIGTSRADSLSPPSTDNIDNTTTTIRNSIPPAIVSASSSQTQQQTVYGFSPITRAAAALDRIPSCPSITFKQCS
ncbi:hypothetical protein VTL71DRAFT_6330 [Oculimacula yallundae]|uniref:Secreted protein n=1 Tax=Oculimacula yallundae TaxID=86028 RepID=A0ABR4BWN5_9HELO